MKNKIHLLVIFGGQSSEHSISIWSANNVIKAIDRNKYNLILVYIDKIGNWYKLSNNIKIDEKNIIKNLKTFHNAYLILKDKKGYLLDLKTNKTNIVDVCFPILHGINGEDGTIQGLLKLYNIKCLGCNVLSSSINMDKIIEKKILKSDNIKVTDFLDYHKSQIKNINFDNVKKHLGLPLFIKPSNGGSSIGSNKVEDKKQFNKAIIDAFKYDNKIIIEKFIKGRELECAIIGNNIVKASIIGEVVSNEKFYSYEDKYVKADGAKLIIPAKLTKTQIKELQEIAMKAYKSLECRGFARVDMFLTDKGEIYLNEINTIPGFTNISMFPKLWGVSGLKYTQLINLLINLALKN